MVPVRVGLGGGHGKGHRRQDAGNETRDGVRMGRTREGAYLGPPRVTCRAGEPRPVVAEFSPAKREGCVTGRGGGWGLRFGRRHDGWSCASFDGARARVNGKGGSSTFLHGGVAICTMVRPETALSRDWVGDGSSRAHGKHRLHVAATFQLGIASPAASGGEGLRSGFATHAC